MAHRLAIGNWKMHTTRAEAVALAADVVAGLQEIPTWDPAALTVGMAPPFVFLDAVGEVLAGSPVELVAQDCHTEEVGAFTSGVSAGMLASLPVRRVIVGHSERRKVFGDDDEAVKRKLRRVLEVGLAPILCVGEDLAQREAGRAEEVVEGQLRAALAGLDPDALQKVVVAYEPVWAIGTGRNATPGQAGDMHRFVAGVLAPLLGGEEALPVLYGGSVKPGNVGELAGTPGVDGVLVGGASLEATSFLEIVRGCVSQGTEPRSA